MTVIFESKKNLNEIINSSFVQIEVTHYDSIKHIFTSICEGNPGTHLDEAWEYYFLS